MNAELARLRREARTIRHLRECWAYSIGTTIVIVTERKGS
jgi:hypothetical protein